MELIGEKTAWSYAKSADVLIGKKLTPELLQEIKEAYQELREAGATERTPSFHIEILSSNYKTMIKNLEVSLSWRELRN